MTLEKLGGMKKTVAYLLTDERGATATEYLGDTEHNGMRIW